MANPKPKAQASNVVQLHTTGTIQPPPLVPVPTSFNLSQVQIALGLIACSALAGAIGAWTLVDSWYGGNAHRELQERVEAVNDAAIAARDRLNQARGAICQ